MSGKRQHYVPRFLQSGFASHANGNEMFTWVHRKGAKSFNTNIINAGVEGHFYSQDGDSQLDDEITAAEAQFGGLIDALRNGTENSTANSESLAELVAHLEVRTRHLRQSFATTAGVVVEELLRFVEDEQAFGGYLRRRIKNDPSFMRDAIAEELRKRGLPDALLPHLLVASQPLLEQMLSSLLADLPSIASHFRTALPQMLKTASKSGHIKALRQSLAPQVKTDQYRNLRFHLARSTEAVLPLGDSMLVFQLNGERPFKPFFEKDDPLQAVYLPLSPSLVLIGSVDDNTPDLAQVPLAIAQCSLEYFISHSRSDTIDDLHTHIGEFAHLLSEDQIDAVITEVMNEQA